MLNQKKQIDIVYNIREIYTIAPANKLRKLIEKHFISSIEEKKSIFQKHQII
jgi:hypothetical protein